VSSTALAEGLLAAMTTGMVTAAGEPVVAEVQETGSPLEVAVEYRHGEAAPSTVTGGFLAPGALLGSQRCRVEEGRTTVELAPLEVAKYEEAYNGHRNATVLHERFLANLAAGAAGPRCTLHVTVSGDGAEIWVPYYAWAPGMHFVNAANLQRAVEAVYAVVQDQQVWDAADLPARVRRIAGDVPPLRRVVDEAGSWRHLVEATTPAGLAAGLEAINPGLAGVVFRQMGTWHGQRTFPA
jgi:hypothetical protein